MSPSSLEKHRFSYVLLFLVSMVAHSAFSLYFVNRYSFHRFANLYDASIFIEIAKSGYSAENVGRFAMFPLFPFFIRILAPIVGYDISALIMVVLFSSMSTVVFYKIAQIKSRFPFLISLFFVFSAYPWFVVSSLPYSEPLFTLLALSTYYLVEKNRYLLSGIAVAGAALTRLAGILLVVIILYGAIKERKLRNAIWTVLPIISLGTLFTYFYFLTGDFLAVIHVERAWASELPYGGTYLVFPFSFILHFVQTGLLLPNYWRIVLLFGVYTYGLYRIRRDVGLLAFSLPTYLLAASLSPFPTFWFGMDRQLVPIFSSCFFAYEKYLCGGRLWNKLLYVALVVMFVLFSWRIVDRWCLLAPVVP